MNRDLSKFESPKAEPDGHTKELFGIPVKFEKDSVEKLCEMCTIPDDIKEQKCECYTCIYAPNKECGWYAACNNCIDGSNYWRKSDE